MFENLSSSPLVLWIAVIIISAVIEAASVQLLTIWFAIGAFAALIAEACSAPFYIQIFVFLFVSIVLLVFTRPILKKLMKKNHKADVNSEVGRTGKVISEINPQKNEGRVMLGDVSWIAKSKDMTVIPVDTEVKIEEVNGTTLIVSEIKKQ